MTTCYVYVAVDLQTGFTKIGNSIQPLQRFNCDPISPKIAGMMRFPTKKDAVRVEGFLHRFYAPLNVRIPGYGREYFDVSYTTVQDFIEAGAVWANNLRAEIDRNEVDAIECWDEDIREMNDEDAILLSPPVCDVALLGVAYFGEIPRVVRLGHIRKILEDASGKELTSDFVKEARKYGYPKTIFNFMMLQGYDASKLFGMQIWGETWLLR